MLVLAVDAADRGGGNRRSGNLCEFLENIREGLVVLLLVEPVRAGKFSRGFQDFAGVRRTVRIERENEPGELGNEEVLDLLPGLVDAMRVSVCAEAFRLEAVLLGDRELAGLDLEKRRAGDVQFFHPLVEGMNALVEALREESQVGIYQKPVLQILGQILRPQTVSHGR